MLWTRWTICPMVSAQMCALDFAVRPTLQHVFCLCATHRDAQNPRPESGDRARDAGERTAEPETQASSASERVYEKESPRHIVQNILFPAIRSVLNPTKERATDNTFVQVACLTKLYRIFERC